MFIYSLTLALAALGSIVYCTSLPVTSWAQVWIPFVAFAVFYAAALLVVVILIIAVSLTVNPRKKYERLSRFYYGFLNECYRFLCCLALIRIHVSGREKLPTDGRFLIVCNHRSNFDNMIQSCSLSEYPIVYVSKPENFKIPVARRSMIRNCYLSIDRDDARKAISTINEAASFISRGIACVGIFPEGHRVKGLRPDDFHAGSFKIAQKAKCPVAVLALRGAQDIHRHFPFRTTHVYLDVVDVLSYETVKNTKTSQLAQLARAEITAALEPQAR